MNEETNHRCHSVVNRKHWYVQCDRECLQNEMYCKHHSKQKSIIHYDPSELNPLESVNNIDIINLEKIYDVCTVTGERKLREGYHAHDLFSYIMIINGKKYQRTLQMDTLKQLFEKEMLIDPFSNLPFPEDIIERAKHKLNRHVSKEKPKTKKEHYLQRKENAGATT